MFDRKAKLAAIESFRATNPDLVRRAEAKGIDWQALLAKVGPLLAIILKILLK